ncbi:fatty acid desaturase family protein [Pseudomonas panipatensis]|uniref:Fatty acid desaturase n=1 Tax=Pseudomonas panipatensis TaxID=428992 RepID=A0A1G8FMK3_9PSED|nr:fatty acid desaturase [Pseudomonas panipatensis]SDH83291.1 Fatty acid desaturase [Pseudomonas panipatensis]SMP52943.1 Fatty acid desaturase [Pseudomonas panipatensis]
MSASVYRYADGRVPNSLALLYAFGGYAAGFALLFADSYWLNACGTLLLGHAMIVAAYLIHEFAHGTIFAEPKHNIRAGEVCSWLCGSCYAGFQDLRRKHMRHHVDRADVITFDTKAFLKRCPGWLRGLVLAAEWAYIPAVELIMHYYVILLPFITANPKHRANRRRVLLTLLVRGALFALVAAISPKALLLYFVAWSLMIMVLRFTDAYQHTYDAFAVLEDNGKIPDDKPRDRAYEQMNTYTNVVSLRWPALDLLLLNFAYHNAHHEKPVAPWYRLRKLHHELYGDGYAQVLPMHLLFKSFHQHRLRRVLDDDYGVVLPSGERRADGFYGAVGVSFLTAV